MGLEDQVRFTDYVPEKDLPILYSMADLLVFPSIYDGFGIPSLVAMACEMPVLISSGGALREATGRNGFIVDPYDVESITIDIYQLLSDEKLRKESVEKAKDWLKRFT